MAGPELQPQDLQNNPEPQNISTRQEQYVVPETQQSLGITAPQVDPGKIATPITPSPAVPAPANDDPTPVFNLATNIARSESELEEIAKKGDPERAKTWLGWHLLRQIKKHISNGVRVVFTPTQPKQ